MGPINKANLTVIKNQLRFNNRAYVLALRCSIVGFGLWSQGLGAGSRGWPPLPPINALD